MGNPPAPLDIKAHLDTLVVGQERAKIELSVLISMHLHWFDHPDPRHRAPNGLVLGPTGVGKTYTIELACQHLKLPFVAVDATALVPSGIVGMQVEDILEDLVERALFLVREREAATAEDGGGRGSVAEEGQAPSKDEDSLKTDEGSSLLARMQLRDREQRDIRERQLEQAVGLASRGVVFLDEFDKLAKSADSTLNERAQRRLLRLTDGGIMSVGQRDQRPKFPGKVLDTSGILFIAGGAFDGIKDSRIRSARPPAIGRHLTNPNMVIAADVSQYGFLPELVGRFPTIMEFEELTADHFEAILAHEDISPVIVWRSFAERLGLKFSISDEAMALVAERARATNLGARGLQQLLFPEFSRLFYEALTSNGDAVVLSPDHFRRRAHNGGAGR